ncbi:MAG: hypothetical protein J7K87_03560 [Candidatus Aenigmarchaeota archaeon]|nr:hypothetical protein [Candidatus Aenigmarchaeota archaeon]
MNESKKVVIGILIFSIFVFIVSLSSLYVQTEISSGNVCGCFIPIPLFIPFIASVGLFIGTLIYYLISPRLNKKKLHKKLLLNFFTGDERKIFGIILEKCEVTQSEIVKLSRLSKVKVFRILRRLENRNLIEKKPLGKTNLIVVNENVKELLN